MAYSFQTPHTNRTKLKGGNLLPLPDAPRDLPWPDLILNWAVAFPNWVIPQLDAMVGMGFNCVRLIGAADASLLGLYTKETYFAAFNQLVAACRARGLQLSTTLCGCAATTYNPPTIGRPNLLAAAQGGTYGTNGSGIPALKILLAAFYAACLAPNLDVIGWLEAGHQEFPGGDGLTMADYARTLGPIPVVVSTGNLTPDSLKYAQASRVSSLSFHWYLFGPYDHQYVQDTLMTTLAFFADPTLPFLIEECGAYTDQVGRAQMLQSMNAMVRFHPDCAGVLQWGPYGTNLGEKHNILDSPYWLDGPPAFTTLSPSDVWAPTVASVEMQKWAVTNKRLTYTLSIANQAVTTTAAALAWDAQTGYAPAPTAAAFIVRSVFRRPVIATAAVTLTASAPVAVSFVQTDNGTGITTVIAGPQTVNGPGQLTLTASLSGSVMPCTYSVQAVALGAGAAVSGSAVLSFGLFTSTAKSIRLPNGKLLRFASGGFLTA